MNQRNMWTLAGLAALGIVLVALPGISRPTPEASKTPPATSNSAEEGVAEHALSQAEFAERLEALRGRAVELASQLKESSPRIIEIADDPKSPSDGDLHIFMSSGGGWLGVGVSEVSADIVKSLKLPEERGALVGRIVPDSPAAKAGLKENDVVLNINGERVEGTEQFRRMIHEIPPGRMATLTIWRDGRSQNVKVTIGKPESNNFQAFSTNPQAYKFKMPELPAMPDLSGLNNLGVYAMVSPGRPLLGIDAESLQGDFGNYFGAPDGEGVLVRDVFGDSPAAKAGLKVGDVITSLDGERVRSASELREKLLAKRAEKTIKLGLLRNKAEITLSVELPQPKEEQVPSLSERTHI
ncbi:MAG TPA: PDZ domain-containing protein [Candidatus Eisenbacteria bacterium]|nr:PDZ domain-containing protein [Candidatus Eisenbacteria bacterium]